MHTWMDTWMDGWMDERKDRWFTYHFSSLQTNAVVLIILFLLWGHSQVVLGFFFANFFNGPRTATIVGYILVIAGVMISLILELLQVRYIAILIHVPYQRSLS